MSGRPELLAPSRDDPLAAALSDRLGGPIGRHAAVTRNSAPATLAALVAGVLSWGLLILRQGPCRELPGHGVNLYAAQCYSDIPLLYRTRGLIDGHIPYLDTGDYRVFEYPVLSGGFVDLMRRLAVLIGAPVGPGLTDSQALVAADRFMAVNVVVLGLLFLLSVYLVARTARGRPWDAMLFAASPCVIAAGAINWDLLPVALSAAGLLLWARRRPALAGVLFGLGAAAKLYPVFLLGPLLVLCLRGRRMRDFASTLGGFLLAWALTNLPVLLAAPREWLSFWAFNADRGGDFGSFWYVLSLAGIEVPGLNVINAAVLLVLCAAIGALILLAPRRPRVAQVAFLVLAAFLMTSKVYSPQYVLWWLPLLVLARPRLREWIVFTVGELVYFAAIWAHLGGYLSAGDGGPDVLYWLAVLLRLATEGWVVAVVVRDILVPAHDPIRRHGEDDPGGGVLEHAPDAAWVTTLRSRVVRFLGASSPAGAPTPASPSGVSGLRAPTSAGLPGPTARLLLIQSWLASRLVIAVVALALAATTERGFADLVGNWDVQHFVNVAAHGYLADPKTMAFFPGLPLLLRAGSVLGIDPMLGGVLLSVLASAAAAAALYRLGQSWGAGRLGGLIAAVLWLFAPTAVFTVVPYTESLFCAAAFWAWERARADRWFAAALLAAAACSVRVSGLFLLGALAVLIVTTAADGLLGRLRRLAWLLLPAAVLLGYLLYLHALTGSWTAWSDAQALGWRRELTMPWDSFVNTLPAALGEYPQWAWMFRFEIVSMGVGLAVTIACLVKRRWAEASWVGVQVLAFSLSYWFFSVNRAVLLWFPLWLLLGAGIGRLPRPGRIVALAAGLGGSALVMGWWAWMFMTGRWAS